MSRVVFVLPSLRISGGVKEALHLAGDLARRGLPTEILSLWLSPHPVAPPTLPLTPLSTWTTRVSRVPLQLPLLALRFAGWLKSRQQPGRGELHAIFTHYSTLPLALLVPRRQRWVFVQDLEWKFIDGPLLGAALRQVILALYRRCRLIAANDYLKTELQALGLRVDADAPIWADRAFITGDATTRDIDLVMVLRKGAHKRLDLYLDLLRLLREHRGLTLAVITPEDEIAEQVRGLAQQVWLRPDLQTMRSAYARARCFVHLSEHEGFGLPPLEAMAAGCVPYCRDSGGVRAYMQGELSALLAPVERPLPAIAQDLRQLLADSARIQHLSAVARSVFEAGLARAATPGAQLSSHLAAA